MFLQESDQAAFREYALHCRRQHRDRTVDVTRCHDHFAEREVDGDFVAVIDARDIAFDNGQPVVDRIAKELAAERGCYDGGHPHQFHDVHGLFARRIDTEVFARNDYVARFKVRRETRRDVIELQPRPPRLLHGPARPPRR